MLFTPYDKESATWQKLKAHLTVELQKLREQNDHPMPDEKRNILVGQIAQVKALLSYDLEPSKMQPWEGS